MFIFLSLAALLFVNSVSAADVPPGFPGPPRAGAKDPAMTSAGKAKPKAPAHPQPKAIPKAPGPKVILKAAPPAPKDGKKGAKSGSKPAAKSSTNPKAKPKGAKAPVLSNKETAENKFKAAQANAKKANDQLRTARQTLKQIDPKSTLLKETSGQLALFPSLTALSIAAVVLFV